MSTKILCDFDGTITTFDTNTVLFDTFGDKNYINKLRRQYYSGQIDLKTLAIHEFNHLKITEETYLNYIKNDVVLQRGFKTFYENLKKANIPIAVVSGGFINGIEAFFNENGIEGIPIYANRLIFNGDEIKVKFYGEENIKENTDSKVQLYRKFKKEYDKVIFIGDGHTDVHVAKEADCLFAKDYLEEYCIENDIEYLKWEDFYDINDYLFPKEDKYI